MALMAAAHLPDQVKIDVVLLEARRNLKSLRFFQIHLVIVEFEHDNTTVTELGLVEPVCCKQNVCICASLHLGWRLGVSVVLQFQTNSIILTRLYSVF